MKRHSRAGYGRSVTLCGVWLLVSASMLVGFQASAPKQADSSYDVILFAKDVMVPMRDGVRLATDVYRPARNGEPVEEKLPILLQRTPYNKEGRGLVESARYFVHQGYVVALQDIRGRYKSEGSFSKYAYVTAPDGYDTLGVAGSACLRRWPGRHVGHILRRTHPGRCRQDESTQPPDRPAQLRRPPQRMGDQGPQPRCLRAGTATRLGFRPGRGGIRGSSGPRDDGSRASREMVCRYAAPQRAQSAFGGARVRELRPGDADARGL